MPRYEIFCITISQHCKDISRYTTIWLIHSNMLWYLVLSTDYKLFLSKYNVCVHNVPFFSDTSTWCMVNMWENVCFCSNIWYYFAKDIAFLYHNIPFVYITVIMRFYITIYHLSRLLWYHYCTSWLLLWNDWDELVGDVWQYSRHHLQYLIYNGHCVASSVVVKPLCL